MVGVRKRATFSPAYRDQGDRVKRTVPCLYYVVLQSKTVILNGFLYSSGNVGYQAG